MTLEERSQLALAPGDPPKHTGPGLGPQCHPGIQRLGPSPWGRCQAQLMASKAHFPTFVSDPSPVWMDVSEPDLPAIPENALPGGGEKFPTLLTKDPEPEGGAAKKAGKLTVLQAERAALSATGLSVFWTFQGPVSSWGQQQGDPGPKRAQRPPRALPEAPLISPGG